MSAQFNKDRQNQNVKKQYISPKLIRFGAISELTSGGTAGPGENAQCTGGGNPKPYC